MDSEEQDVDGCGLKTGLAVNRDGKLKKGHDLFCRNPGKCQLTPERSVKLYL